MWKWSTAGLLVYLLLMHSLWYTERQSLQGAWHEQWDTMASRQWHADQLVWQQELAQVKLACHQAEIPERQKWTRPLFGKRPAPPLERNMQRIVERANQLLAK